MFKYDSSCKEGTHFLVHICENILFQTNQIELDTVDNWRYNKERSVAHLIIAFNLLLNIVCIIRLVKMS